MLKYFRQKVAVVMMAFLSLGLTGCSEETTEVVSAILDFLLGMLGYNMEDENVSDEEQADEYDENEDGSLPSSVDLQKYFPPIGNQGSYGTCVAWATGYAMKTALNAKEKGWTSSQLSSPSNQSSPVDLWHLIDANGKSTGCNGSNFEPAMEAIQKNGLASMASVPFTNKKMTCDGVKGVGNSSNKLGQYRIIAYTAELSGSKSYGMTAENFKFYLSKGYPILIGARLGENFMAWNSSSVLKSDTKDYQGQHAYHAMVCVGYDNSKKAFRVRNSWGANEWGDNGSIWIDESFFIKQFCFGGWIACNSGSTLSTARPAEPSPLRSANGAKVDLAAHIISDYANADGTRTLEYDVENVGKNNVSSEQGWSVVYMIYERKNLNDKFILMHDYYSDEVANGKITKYSDGLAVYGSQSTMSNVNIPAGSSVAEQLGGKKLKFTYKLPAEADGEYFLVLMVNPFDEVNDVNLDNNYSFVSNNGDPIVVAQGRVLNMPSSLKDVRSLISDKNWNTYSGVELNNMLRKQARNGKLKKQVQGSSLRSGSTIAKSVVK